MYFLNCILSAFFMHVTVAPSLPKISSSLGNLGDPCFRNEDCSIAYATCQKGSCECLNGFTKLNGACMFHVNCPVGQPLRENNVITSCDVQALFNLHLDSCPSTHFCFEHPLALSQNHGLSGHCCPKLPNNTKITPACAVGQPLSGSVCGAKTTSVKSTSNCPQQTHICSPMGSFSEEVCCPIPCANHNSVSYRGRCYHQLPKDEPCEIDVQCPSECKQDEDGKHSY